MSQEGLSTVMGGAQHHRQPTDILAVEEETAPENSENLRLQLNGEDGKQLTIQVPQNPEAYRAYLQGRYYWNKRDRLENALLILCFDPDARVHQRNVEKTGSLRPAISTLGFLQFLSTTHLHRHPSPFGRKLYRVTQKVIEDLLELGGIGFYWKRQ